MKNYKEMAHDILARRDEYEKRKREGIKFAAVFAVSTACLVLVIVLGFDMFRQERPIQLAQGGESQNEQMTDGDAPIAVQSEHSQTESEFAESQGESDRMDVYLPYIRFHELSKIPAATSRLYFDPDKYDKVYYNQSETEKYFGRTLVPQGAVRSPLKMHSGGRSTQFIEKQSGKIVYDSTCITYANDFYKDGSPLSATEGGINLTVWASRLGRPNICYAWENTSATEVKGIKVYAGKIEVGYNYNEQKEPQNFYTELFAEFEVDGVYYEVIGENISETEFLRAVWGIIAC